MPVLPKRLAKFGRELFWFPLSSSNDSSRFSEPLNEGRIPSEKEGAEDIVEGRSEEDEKRKGGKSSSLSSSIGSVKRRRRRVSDAVNLLRRQRSKSNLRRHSQSTFYVSKEEEDTILDDKEEESNHGFSWSLDLVGDLVEGKTQEVKSLLTEINCDQTCDVNHKHGAQLTDCYENRLICAVDREATTTYTKCIRREISQSCPNFLITTDQSSICFKPQCLQPRRHSLALHEEEGKEAEKLVKNSGSENGIHLSGKINVVLKEGDCNLLQSAENPSHKPILFTPESKWTQSVVVLKSENIQHKPRNISLASFLECETHDRSVLDSHSNVTKFSSDKSDIIDRSIVGSANCESGVFPSHSGVDESCTSLLSSDRSSSTGVQKDHHPAREENLHSLNQTMDSVPLREDFYCRSQSTDSAVITTKTSPSFGCSASEKTRLSPEKRNQKCNKVMSKIKRFARSQSQTRICSTMSQTPSPPSPMTSPSILASSHLIANNHHHLTENSTTLVSKTRDFYKDVKKRFSYQNPSTNDKEAEKYEDKVDGGSLGNLPKDLFLISSANCSSSGSGSVSGPVILPDSVEPIFIRPRIRRFASDESLPSDSGCGSSIKTGSLSTDSNRSSICTIEDVNSIGVLFRGPFIGQARAVLDCTPCPYDKDALAFKKGDIVNIIAKNDSGTWIGMANGKIGHFKFISVEESQSVNKLSRFKCRIRPKCSTITSNNTNGSSASSCEHRTITVANTKPDGESSESNTDIEHILESVKYLISTQPELNIGKLLEDVLDLKEETLYSKALAENGFSTLMSLKSLESPCTLKSCGINNSGHQNLILYVAKMVRESMKEEPNIGKEKEEAETEDGDGLGSDADLFGSIESSLIPRKVQRRRRRHTLDYFKSVQSAPVTPAIEYTEDSLCDWFQNGMVLNLEKKMEKSEDLKDNEYSCGRRVDQTEEPSEEAEDNKGNPKSELKQFKEESSNSRPINSAQNVIVIETAKASPLSKSTVLNNASLVQNLNKKVFNRGTSSKPKPSITSSKSSIDLRPSSQNSANINDRNNGTGLIHGSHHHYSNTKRRIKKFLHTERKSTHGPNLSDTSSKDSHPKRHNSISSLQTTKPISELLLDNLTHRLKSESIDLTMEPYSDASGFCEIPPALVQRYAEELERDVYEVADALDHIRLCCLKLKCRAGIPNDFLGDSCSGPIVEQAIYDNLTNWFTSIGLPMYEAAFREKGIRDLMDISRVRESELQSFGVLQPSHQRALSNAISALSLYIRKDDKA